MGVCSSPSYDRSRESRYSSYFTKRQHETSTRCSSSNSWKQHTDKFHTWPGSRTACQPEAGRHQPVWPVNRWKQNWQLTPDQAVRQHINWSDQLTGESSTDNSHLTRQWDSVSAGLSSYQVKAALTTHTWPGSETAHQLICPVTRWKWHWQLTHDQAVRQHISWSDQLPGKSSSDNSHPTRHWDSASAALSS